MPVAVWFSRLRTGLITAESRLEAESASERHDDILQRAMMLVAGRILTLFDEASGGVRAGHVLDEESPEPLAWRVEAGTVIQPANEHQEFVERDGHGNA